jgi:hypothetical protein
MGILLRDLLEARVGIELKRMMKRRKLIPLKSKNAKNTVFAQVQYTPGTQVLRFRYEPSDFATYLVELQPHRQSPRKA